MASAVIGALRVTLSADTAAFETGLVNAGARLGAFAKTAKAAGAAIAAGLGAAAAGLSASMKSAVDRMDAIGKLGQKIGVPVAQLSALAHAAELSGVGLEGLAAGFRKLSVNMAAAAQGSASAAQGFRTLGVGVQNADGSLRPVADVLADVADKFAGLEDGAAKTALAVQVFGKSGADLIPLLNAGAAGLRGMLQEAEALGLTFGAGAAKAAEEFNDNLTRLHGVFGGIVTQLTADLLPVLVRFSDFLVDAARNGGLVRSVSGALASAFMGLARAIKFVYDNIGILIGALAAFLAFRAATFVVNLGIAFVNLAKTIKAAGLVMAAFNAVQNASRAGLLLLAGGLLFATGQIDSFKAAIADLGQTISEALPEDFRGRLSSALGDLGLNTDALRDDLFEIGEVATGATEAQAAYRLAIADTAEATRDANAALKEQQQAIADGAQVIEQAQGPLEAYRQQIARLGELQRAGAIDAQTFARAQMMAAASALSPWLQVADTAGQALGEIFEENKTVAIAQAIINTLQGITQAIAHYPPPLSFAMAAAQAALGFAQVAKIRSTTRKSSGGGAVAAAGGGGTVPGGGAAATTGSATPARAVFISLQGEIFGREQVRGLVEQLKEYQRDGGTIILG